MNTASRFILSLILFGISLFFFASDWRIFIAVMFLMIADNINRGIEYNG
jgi:hypothetical protein